LAIAKRPRTVPACNCRIATASTEAVQSPPSPFAMEMLATDVSGHALGLLRLQFDGYPQSRPAAAHDILDFDHTTRLIDSALGDRKAKPGALAARLAATEEGLKYARDVSLRDAGPAILDLDDRHCTFASDAKIDRAAIGRKLDRIFNDVADRG